MNRTSHRLWRILLHGLALAALPVSPGGAVADERKFVVLLAAPVKSQLPLPLPNPNDVYDHYFDRVKPNINSFAEYWNEISHGNVNVNGDVFGWAEIPWPVMPPGGFTYGVLPYTELNGNGLCDQFAG